MHPVRPAFRLGSPGRKTPSLAAREPERRRAQNRVRAGRRLYKSRPSERRGNVHPPTDFSIATLLPGFLFPSIKQTCLPARSPRSSSSVSPLSCRSPPRTAAAVHSRTRSQSILLTLSTAFLCFRRDCLGPEGDGRRARLARRGHRASLCFFAFSSAAASSRGRRFSSRRVGGADQPSPMTPTRFFCLSPHPPVHDREDQGRVPR